jgi:DNA-binding response OmpR family regulator
MTVGGQSCTLLYRPRVTHDMPVPAHNDNSNASCDVLIVEDNTFVCDVMSTFLAQRGLAVRTAPAATAALAVLDEMTPRVAVLDYHLPGINGVQLAGAMRQRGLAVPIIMMSANIVVPEEETLRKLGVRLFIHKPVPLLPLYQAITRLVRAIG